MKKVICTAAILAAFISCQKKNKLTAEASSQTTETTISSNTHSSARTIPTQYRQFSRIQGSYSCSGKDGNCLPDVVVKPRALDYTLLTGLISVTSGGNSDNIRHFFSANQTALRRYISAEEINAIITGEDQVKNYVNLDGISNYLVFTSKDAVMLVLPLIMG